MKVALSRCVRKEWETYWCTASVQRRVAPIGYAVSGEGEIGGLCQGRIEVG